MKIVENKTFSLKSAEGLTTTKDLLSACLNWVPTGGLNLGTIRARSRVLNAIEGPLGGEIKLEDADFKTAKDAVAGMVWGAVHKDIVAFAEQFEV